MMKIEAEKTLAKILYFGVPFTTVFILTGSVSDPVNVTKLLSASIFGFAALALLLTSGVQTLWHESKPLLISALLLLITMFSASIASESSFSTNFYGIFGRNTGLLAYCSFLFLALAAAVLRNQNHFERVVVGLLTAGAINVAYCLWAWQIGDFISWNNPFGTILGTFGNPNFISSFLGIFISAVTSYLILGTRPVGIKLIAVVFIVIAFLEILHTHSIQGIVVTGIGLAYNGFLFVRSKFKSSIWLISYSTLVVISGVTAIAGMLQKGPLTSYLYKTSVSLRGEYWQAGINMGLSNPLTGIGMDGYGNFYRQERDAGAIILPGASVVTNAAHNVIADFFAYGGYPLLVAYLFFLGIGLRAIFLVIRRQRNFDSVFAAISVSWICYQSQSIISINQIGLAIWGWVLTGALVGYEISSRLPEDSNEIDSNLNKRAKNKTKESVVSSSLVAGIGMIVGLLISLPPYNADTTWRNALNSQKLENVEKALTSSYMTPSDSARLSQAVNLLEQSKLYDLSYKYGKYAVEFNPNYFDAWKLLYFINKSTEADKAEALSNLKRLDPLNPDVLAVPK
jgi:hypothetical protein